MSKREDINLQHLAQFVEHKFPKNRFNIKITGGGNDVEVDIEITPTLSSKFEETANTTHL